MSISKTLLRRYTNLPAVIRMLKTSTITFLNPATWDDKNDSYFMELYKDSGKLKSVLAICFSQESETYHHWRVFADGPSGVCVAFKKQELIDSVQRRKGVSVGEVEYVRIKELDEHWRTTEALPFLKRAPFGPECEFRFVYTSKRTEYNFLDVDIKLSTIERIYLSPWMPKAVAESVKEVLYSIAGGAGFRVSRSTLIQNDTWAEYGRRVAGFSSDQSTLASED